MKKAMLLIAAIALVSFSFAQSPTDALFDKYGAKEGFTTVHVTKELFNLFADIAQEAEGEEIKDFQEVVGGLDYIRILMYDANDGIDLQLAEEFKAAINAVKLKDYTELMTVKENNELVRFMIRKDGENINELLLLLNQGDEAGFISITGNIDLKSIAKLSKSMNINGLEQLQRLDKENK